MPSKISTARAALFDCRWPIRWQRSRFGALDRVLATFDGKLLHAIFAEEREAERGGFEDGFGGKGFGDGHQLYFAARAAGGAAGGGDPVFNPFEIFLEFRHSAPSPAMRERAVSSRPVALTCCTAAASPKRGMLA